MVKQIAQDMVEAVTYLLKLPCHASCVDCDRELSVLGAIVLL